MSSAPVGSGFDNGYGWPRHGVEKCVHATYNIVNVTSKILIANSHIHVYNYIISICNRVVYCGIWD